MTDDDTEDDLLHGLDLAAWQPPAPPGSVDDLADRVIARMAIPEVAPAPNRRAWWLAGGAALGAVIVALGVIVLRSPDVRAPGVDTGAVVASKPEYLELGDVTANLDPGAELRWIRDPSGVRVDGLRGRTTWKIAGDARLRIDTGAMGAAVEATGASLRVEVQMNASDVKIAGTSAVIAAVVSLITVVVYEGHVKATSGGQTITIAPGSTVELAPDTPPRAAPESRDLVGAAPVAPTEVNPATTGTTAECRQLQAERKWADLVRCAERLGATDPWAGTTLAGHANREAIAEVVASKIVEIIRDQNLGRATELLRTIPEDSVYFADAATQVRELESHARDKWLERGRAYAVAHGCAALEKLVEQAPTPAIGRELERLDCTPRTCDAEALKAQGITLMSSNFDTAALLTFEAANRCKPDPVLVRLMAHAACKAKDAAKARTYYARVAERHRSAVEQTCVSNGIRLRADAVQDTTPACDAEALKTKGLSEMSENLDTAALQSFEHAYRCKPSPVLVRLVALAACKSRNATKATKYYPLVPAANQVGVAATCARTKTAYQ